MLEHQPPPQNPSELSARSASVSKPSEEREQVAAPIEAYLDSICASLSESLPEEARDVWRREMQTHLEERIAALRELGDSPEQAVAHALQQFGKSSTIERAWERAAQPAVPQSAAQATRIGLGLFGGTTALFALALYCGGSLPRDLMSIWVLLHSVPAGIGVGLLVRNRAVRGAFYAQALLYLPLMAITLHNILWPRVERTLLARGAAVSLPNAVAEIFHGKSGLLNVLDILLLVGVYWMGQGCLAAGIGGWLQKRLPRRKQRLA